MNTTQTPFNALTSLDHQDRALLELLQTERYNIHALVNRQNPSHPAQTSILDLLDWVSRPDIDRAIQYINQLHNALSANADKEAHLIAKKSLSHALAVAASMIPHFDTCPENPDDPQAAERFAKHTETLIRETRLLARTLLKLSPPPAPPRRSRATSIDSAADTDQLDNTTLENDTAAADATSESNTTTNSTESTSTRASRGRHASRLNRNSRKPAFSPAEVAEILSALLDHDADLSSRAFSSKSSSTPLDPAFPAPHSTS